MLKGCRLCRREAEKLFLKGDRCLGQKCAVVKRPYPPGIHGPKGRIRQTDYAKQLREKQKTRRYYQLAERQFSNYYKAASQKTGNTSEILWQFLELRLDNVIRRSRLTASLSEARQLVSHGAVKVNGEKVDIPSYQLKTGDKVRIEVKKELPNKQDLPDWISLNPKTGEVSIATLPSMETSEIPFNISLVIEFYSK